MAKIAINGLGRIGRAALKVVLDTPQLELVAVNDIAPIDNLVYLLRYDTVYGRYGQALETEGDDLIIGGKRDPAFHEKDPPHLPWAKLGVDIVLECTGAFAKREDLSKHIRAGAGCVILSARPAVATWTPSSTGSTTQQAACRASCHAPAAPPTPSRRSWRSWGAAWGSIVASWQFFSPRLVTPRESTDGRNAARES